MYTPKCYEDYKVVNCAYCDQLLSGESMEEWVNTLSRGIRTMKRVPPFIFKRIEGRPYCKDCILEIRRINEEQKKYVRS